MYKIFIKILLFTTLPVLATLAMEEQVDVKVLLQILRIKPTELFYKALPIVKQYNEQEIETLAIDPELRAYAHKLKHKINKRLVDITNNARQMRTLLNAGANINTQNKAGETVLFQATHLRKYDRVKQLLERGANPNIPTLGGVTALIDAAGSDNDEEEDAKALKIAQLLIENNANVHAVDEDNASALTLATMSSADKMVELLLKHGADPNSETTEFNVTPLMLVAATAEDENEQKRINIIGMLLKYGAKLFKTNSEGRTAYDIAEDEGNTEIANVLKEAMRKRAEQILKPQAISENA